MHKILLTERDQFTSQFKEKLTELGLVTEIGSTREELLLNIHDKEILIVALANKVDKEVLSKAQNLKIIVSPTTGLDHIDEKFAQERNIKIISLRGEIEFLKNVTATAELTWGLILSLTRKIPAAVAHVASGGWNRYDFKGIELKGKTLGIIGYGRLGKIVAEYAKAFRMKVLTYDINENVRADERVNLEELLKGSDIISLHIPLNDENKGFFSHLLMSKMKNGSFLINTSRGKIVDEVSLIEFLKNGKILGYAADVLSDESSQNDSWIKNNIIYKEMQLGANVILTPHVGGYTSDSIENVNSFILSKLISCIDF